MLNFHSYVSLSEGNYVKYSLVKSILWYIFDGIYWEYLKIELPIDIVFFMGSWDIHGTINDNGLY